MCVCVCVFVIVIFFNYTVHIHGLYTSRSYIAHFLNYEYFQKTSQPKRKRNYHIHVHYAC